MSLAIRAARIILPGLLATATWAAPGDPGSGGSSPSMGTQKHNVERQWRAASNTAQRGVDQGAQISGRVFDGDAAPLPGVIVKLFSNGVLMANAQTDVGGSFEIGANPDAGRDVTTDLWFEMPQAPNTDSDTRLLDANVLISEGSTAKENKLFSPCTQKVNFLGNAVSVEVTLLTLKQTQKLLLESDCMSVN